MSNALDGWWGTSPHCRRVMRALLIEGNSTTGRIARISGVSYRTARKYLDAMVAVGSAEVYREIAPNGVVVRVYSYHCESE